MDDDELARLIGGSLDDGAPRRTAGRRDRLAAAILAGFGALLPALPVALILGADPSGAILGVALGDPFVLMGLGR